MSNISLKIKILNQWKDKWFYYKLLLSLTILSMLLTVYLSHMINEQWLRKTTFPFSAVIFQGEFISFFTYQSNFIVAIWFFFAAIVHNKFNSIINNQNITIAITSYISVTGFVFDFIIFPASFFVSNNENFDALSLISSIFFHFIVPILTITYLFFHWEQSEMSWKKYFKKTFWLTLIYPWCYTFYLIYRIHLFTSDPAFRDYPIEIIYPYSVMLFPNSDPFAQLSNAIYSIYSLLILLPVVHILFISINITYFAIIKRLTKIRNSLNKKLY